MMLRWTSSALSVGRRVAGAGDGAGAVLVVGSMESFLSDQEK
jgi:hypothetical protein